METLVRLRDFFMPLREQESPAWFIRTGRLLVALSILLVPLLYDAKVAEVAGDIRWIYLHIVTALLVVLFFSAKAMQKNMTLSLRLPIAAWAVLLVAVIATLSLLWTYNPLRSWWFLKHLLAYSGLFAFLFLLRDEKWYRNLLWLVAAGVGFNSLLGIAQFNGITDATMAGWLPFGLWEAISPFNCGVPNSPTACFIDFFRQSAPPAGTLANKNLTGSYLVLTLPIVLYLFLSSRSKWGQALSFVVLTLATTLLVYTRSRGSWLAMLAAIVFFGLWLLINKPHRQALAAHLSWVRGGLIAAALVIVALMAQLESPLKGYHSVGKSVTEQAASITNMTAHEMGPRLAYNLNGIDMFLDRPLTGSGINTFHTMYPAYYNARYETPRLGYSVSARPQRMHNDLFQAFVELGLFGGLGYLIMFGSIFFMSWQLSRTKKAGNASFMALFVMTGMTGLSVNALGDFPLQMPTAPTLLWAFLGLLTGLYVMYRPKEAYVGWKRTFTLPRAVPVGLAILATVGLVLLWQDDMARREGAKALKITMAHVQVGMYNENALRYARQTYSTYPYNSRGLEYHGIVLANYEGKGQPATDTVIETLEELLAQDPYSPNALINIGSFYARKAERLMRLGEDDEAEVYANKAVDAYKRLLIVAPFSDYTYNVGAMIYMLTDNENKALSLYNKALEINPANQQAMMGKRHATAILKQQGRYEAFEKGGNKIRLELNEEQFNQLMKSGEFPQSAIQE